MTGTRQWVRTYFPELALAISAIVLCALTLAVLQPVGRVYGDAPSYLQAMHILAGEPASAYFMPNRILTTFGGLQAVRAVSAFTGGYISAWFILNVAFFFALAAASFMLLRRVAGWPAAFVGVLFIIGNYDVLSFGLTYGMDIGGWVFYMLALYVLYRYVEGSARRDLLLASALVGVGVLFKEYAAVAVVPIAAVLIYEAWPDPVRLIKTAFIPAVIATAPLICVHAYVYIAYHYTYLDWYRYNDHQYGYHGWLVNAIKSFGVTLSLLAIPACIGLVQFFRSGEYKRDRRRSVFLLSLLVPAVVILVWPSITERVTFLAVPTAAVFATLCFERSKRFTPLFAILLIAYVALSLAMDSYVLPLVNIPF